MASRGGPLSTRDFRLLLTGSTVSLVGDGIYSVAMAVAALRTADPVATLALVAVCGLVPRVAFSLLGGLLADRVSRRLVLLAADLVRLGAVTLLGIGLLDGRAELWLLLTGVVPVGAASGMAAPAFAAIVPDVVSEADLVRANSVLSSVSPLAQMMLGPAVGGVLASIDLGLAMLLDAATFAVSAGSVLLLRPARQHEDGVSALPWAQFREGLAYVRSKQWLMVNLLCGVLVSFAVSGSFTMLPLLVTEAYGAPGAAFGYLLGLGGAAATGSAMVVGLLRPPRRPLAASYLLYVVGLAAVAALGLAPDVWVAAPFVVLLFVGTTAGNIWQDSVLGSRIPRDLRGRVSSLDWVAAGATAALGSLLGLMLLLRSGEPAGASEHPGADVVQAGQRFVVRRDAVDAPVDR